MVNPLVCGREALLQLRVSPRMLKGSEAQEPVQSGRDLDRLMRAQTRRPTIAEDGLPQAVRGHGFSKCGRVQVASPGSFPATS